MLTYRRSQHHFKNEKYFSIVDLKAAQKYVFRLITSRQVIPS